MTHVVCEDKDLSRVWERFPFCPICDELIVEPVTFPCGHELCLSCYRSCVDSANFCCCICRKRVSTWARRNSTNPVNSVRKTELDRVYSSLGSLDDIRLAVELQREEEFHVLPSPCECGEISEEYQDELRKLKKERLAEEELSIKEVQKYQTDIIEFDRKRRAQEIEDERLARLISEDEMGVAKGVASTQIEKDRRLAEQLEENLNPKKKRVSSVQKRHFVSKNKATKGRSSTATNKQKEPQFCSVITKWFSPQPEL